MKLKYLLPAATIASAAAIVTPLITSCNKNGIPNSWNLISQGKYTSKIKPYNGGEKTYSDEEATIIYGQQLKKKTLTYNDDIFTLMSDELSEEEVKDLKKAYKKVSISNVSTIDMSLPESYKERKKMINATITMSCDFNCKINDEPFVLSFNAKITNFKMWVSALSASGDKFWFRPSVSEIQSKESELLTFLTSDEDWKINAKGTLGTKEFEFSYDHNITPAQLAKDKENIEAILQQMSCQSHFLGQMKATPDLK